MTSKSLPFMCWLNLFQPSRAYKLADQSLMPLDDAKLIKQWGCQWPWDLVQCISVDVNCNNLNKHIYSDMMFNASQNCPEQHFGWGMCIMSYLNLTKLFIWATSASCCFYPNFFPENVWITKKRPFVFSQLSASGSLLGCSSSKRFNFRALRLFCPTDCATCDFPGSPGKQSYQPLLPKKAKRKIHPK